jgi:hypothetical protein
MGSDNHSIAGPNDRNVASLCESFWRLNHARAHLDRRLIAMPDDDQGRDLLWQELESILTRISALVAHLATVDSIQLRDSGAKASVLARLLRTGEINPPAPAAETVALALSLADEVATLTEDLSHDGFEDTKRATRPSIIS